MLKPIMGICGGTLEVGKYEWNVRHSNPMLVVLYACDLVQVCVFLIVLCICLKKGMPKFMVATLVVEIRIKKSQ